MGEKYTGVPFEEITLWLFEVLESSTTRESDGAIIYRKFHLNKRDMCWPAKIAHPENIESPKSDFLRTCYKLMKTFTKQVDFPKPLELIKCTIQYINYLLNYCENCDVHKLKWFNLNRLFQCISEVFSSPHMKDLFVHVATQQVLDLTLAPSIHTWPKKKLLNMYNAIVQGSTRSVRAETLAAIGNMYLYKLFDLLDICGDYEHQTVVLETILRICGKSNLKSKGINELIPHSEKLRQAFMSIDISDFEEDARTFLNIYNVNNPKIFSVLCCWIRLDEQILKQSTETRSSESIWMDFDLVDHTLSWSCDNNSMSRDITQANHWETVHVSARQVENVKIRRSEPNRQCLIVTLILNDLYVPLTETAQLTLKDVKVLTFCTFNSQTINHLILEVFPVLFGKKYSKTTLRHRTMYNKRSVPGSNITITISDSTSSCKPYSKTSREMPIGIETTSSVKMDTTHLSYAGTHNGSVPGSVISISSSNSTSSYKPLREVPIGVEARSSEKTETICTSYSGNRKSKLTDSIFKQHELADDASYCDRGSVADTVLFEKEVHIVPEVANLVKFSIEDDEHIPSTHPRIETSSTVIYNKLFLEEEVNNLNSQIAKPEDKTVHIQQEYEKSKTNEAVLRHKNNKHNFKKSIGKVIPTKRVRNSISKAKRQINSRKQKKMIRTAINKMQRDFERVHGKPVKNGKVPFTFEQCLERFKKEMKVYEQITEFRRPTKLKNKNKEQSEFGTKKTIKFKKKTINNRFNFEWEHILELLKKETNEESGTEATSKQNQELIKTQNISNESCLLRKGQKKENKGQKRKISNNVAVQPSKQKSNNTALNSGGKIIIISNIHLAA